MKINITNGVQQVVDSTQKKFSSDKQWYELRNRVDVILLSNNVKSAGDKLDVRKLDNMSHEERQKYILSKWGSVYLDRCLPILIQLDVLEKGRK